MKTIFALESTMREDGPIFGSKLTHIVPSDIRNRWRRFLYRVTNIHFMITHIFREGNKCVDKLTNLGIDSRVQFF